MVEKEDEIDKEKKLCKLSDVVAIDTRMLPAKFAYILYGGNVGSHVAFLNLFFTSVGLSAGQAGFITGIRFTSAALATPLWGYITDYTGRRKLILTILCIGAALPMFSMPWVSKWIYRQSDYAACSGANSTHANSSILFPYHSVDEIKQCELNKERAADTLFYVLMGIVTFASTFLVPLPGYIDTIVMNVVKTGDRKASYGGQRIFGSLGFSVANLLAGIAAEGYSFKDMSQYTAVFYLFLPYTLLMIPVGFHLIGQTSYPPPTRKKMNTVDQEAVPSGANISRLVWEQMKKFDVIFFMITVLLNGLSNNLFMNFAYMFVQDELMKTNTEMTFVVVTASMSEMLVFPLTSKIIRFVGGNPPAIAIGMFSYFIRFLVMSYDVEFPVFIAVQAFHSLGFALAFAAIMEHIHEISPPEINVTMNSIMMTLFFSVSNIIANVVGGEVYENYKGKTLFFGKAIICGVWTLFMVIYYGGKILRNRYIRKNNSVNFHFSSNEMDTNDPPLGYINPMLNVADEKEIKITLTE